MSNKNFFKEFESFIQKENSDLPQMMNFISNLKTFLNDNNLSLEDISGSGVEMVFNDFRSRIEEKDYTNIIELQKETLDNMDNLKNYSEVAPEKLFSFVNSVKLMTNIKLSKDSVNDIIPLFKDDYTSSLEEEEQDILHFLLANYNLNVSSLNQVISYLEKSEFNFNVFSEKDGLIHSDYYSKSIHSPSFYPVLFDLGVEPYNNEIKYNALSHIIANCETLDMSQLENIDALIAKDESIVQIDDKKRSFPIFNLFFRVNIKNSETLSKTQNILNKYNWDFSKENLKSLLKDRISISNNSTNVFVKNISVINIFEPEDLENKFSEAAGELSEENLSQTQRDNMTRIIEAALS